MFFLRFSLFLSLTFSTYAIFDSTSCLKTSYSTTISHKGFPFGWAANKLHIKKTQCEIEINLHELFYLHNRWIVDVCRGPIHIKFGKRSISIIKRQGACPKDNPFCKELHRIEEILQDNGLIFAQGNKEKLSDDHGKIYCSYLLIERYLREGMVLGSHTISKEKFWENREGI